MVREQLLNARIPSSHLLVIKNSISIPVNNLLANGIKVYSNENISQAFESSLLETVSFNFFAGVPVFV